MRKKQLEFGITGLIIGVAIGALLGLGELNFVKKSQRPAFMPFAIGITAIIGACVGYGIGSNMGKSTYIEDALGISKPTEDGYYKDGRYWVGRTSWKDTRDGKEYNLITRRNGSGVLVSYLNNKEIWNHQIPSANQQTVPKHHQLAKNNYRIR